MARLIDADELKIKVQLYANEPVKLRDRRWDIRCTAIIADMIGMIDTAPTVGGWISVKERLPVGADTVLIAHKSGVSFAWFNGAYWTKGAATKHKPIKTVTHWMPLQEPPKEGDANA